MGHEIGDVLGTITTHNTASHRFAGIAECVLPLPKGALPPGTWRVGLSTETGLGVGSALPAQWEDGSPRYLFVRVPVEVDPGAEVTTALTWCPEVPTFNTPEALFLALKSLEIHFHVGGSSVRINGTEKLVGDDGVGLTYRSRVRVGDVWGELIATLYSGQMYVGFTFQFGYGAAGGEGNPLAIDCPPIKLRVERAYVEVLHTDAKVLHRVDGEGVATLTLCKGGALAAGQGSALGGRLLFWADEWRHLVGEAQVQTLLAVRERPVISRASAADWILSEGFGPFGELLPHEAPSREIVDGHAFRDYLRRDCDLWEQPQRGCRAYPPQTGEQEGFGVVEMRQEVVSDATMPLALIQRAVYQEACRPTHYRDKAVRPFRFDEHPNALMSDGHINPAIDRESVDTLGYDHTTKHNGARAPDGQRWEAHDREHLSLNYLCAYALVTGDPWAYRECEHKAELWLAEFNQDRRRGRWVVAARAVGRPLAAACWLWLVTGREDLRRAIDAHATYHHQQYHKRRESVLAPRDDDPERAETWWVPWEEACAAYGLAMVHRLFHHAAAGQLSRDLADKVTRDGIGWLPDSKVGVAYKPPLRLPNGNPWSAADPAALLEHHGPSMLTWSLPALVISWKRSTDEDTSERARLLLRDVLTPTPKPESEVWDWLALEGFALSDLVA